jgi:hypothetical protein
LLECWSNPGFLSVFSTGLTLKSTKLLQEVCDFLEKIVTFCYRAVLIVKKVHHFSGKSETFLEDSDFHKKFATFHFTVSPELTDCTVDLDQRSCGSLD